MRGADDEERRQSTELRRARRAARGLDDHALLDAMQKDDPLAWLEFDQRFRPVLERYAVHTEIPIAEWPDCIDEVLTDVAIKLTSGSVVRPRSVVAYLIRAVRNAKLINDRRTSTRRRLYDAVAENVAGERVVRAMSSEFALRASAGTLNRRDDDPYATAAVRLTDALLCDLGADDIALLGWAAECIPHRTIAEWTGASYEATTKRIWRLCQRLRKRAREIVAAWPDDAEREAVARMVGLVAPSASAPGASIGRASGGAER